jgi:hypothetical protein
MIKFIEVATASKQAVSQLGSDGSAMAITAGARLKLLSQGGMIEAIEGSGTKVALCSHALMADFKIKWALPLQILMLLEHRLYAKIHLVTFGEDLDIRRWIMDKLQFAIDIGVLELASGGRWHLVDMDLPPEIGRVRSWAGEFSKDKAMTKWHCSKGKNASHMFGLLTNLERDSTEVLSPPTVQTADKGTCWTWLHGIKDLILVCLDADNVYQPEYISNVIQVMEDNRKLTRGGGAPSSSWMHSESPSADPKGGSAPIELPSWLQPACLPCRPKAHTAELTGRIAVWATDYLAVGGYDEEAGVQPSGYQDVDLLRRLVAAATPFGSPKRDPLEAGGGGTAFPNMNVLPSDSHYRKKWERNDGKVQHCEEIFKEQGWAALNTANVNIMKKKLANGDISRNMTRGQPYRDLPAFLWWSVRCLGAPFAWDKEALYEPPKYVWSWTRPLREAEPPNAPAWPPKRPAKAQPAQKVHVRFTSAGTEFSQPPRKASCMQHCAGLRFVGKEGLSVSHWTKEQVKEFLKTYSWHQTPKVPHEVWLDVLGYSGQAGTLAA